MKNLTLRDRILLAMEDLQQARSFGLVLQEASTGDAMPDPSDGSQDQQRQQTIRVALEIALVVAYARPFTQQRDRHGAREQPLTDILDCLEDSELNRHEHFVSVVRNQEYAHSDASRRDIAWHEYLAPSGKRVPFPIMRNTFAPISESALRGLVGICEKLIQRLLEKRESELT